MATEFGQCTLSEAQAHRLQHDGIGLLLSLGRASSSKELVSWTGFPSHYYLGICVLLFKQQSSRTRVAEQATLEDSTARPAGFRLLTAQPAGDPVEDSTYVNTLRDALVCFLASVSRTIDSNVLLWELQDHHGVLGAGDEDGKSKWVQSFVKVLKNYGHASKASQKTRKRSKNPRLSSSDATEEMEC